jgi:hypothetical protein
VEDTREFTLLSLSLSRLFDKSLLTPPSCSDHVEWDEWKIPVHAIAIEPNTSGRRMLEAVAEMTDGSFTLYDFNAAKEAIDHAKDTPNENWASGELRRSIYGLSV